MSEPVKLSEPELTVNGQEALVTTFLTGIEPAGQIRFRFTADRLPDQAAMNDGMFPIGLVLAMATGRRLELDFPVSEDLLASSSLINEIYGTWFPEKIAPIHVEVSARKREDDRPKDERVSGISAFTGGVDSFATALRQRDNIGAHFYVFGYDLPLDSKLKGLRDNVRSNLNAAAGRLGKSIIFVTTNVRTYLNPHTNWAHISHGPAIAAVGHLLSASYNALYIPSSFTYNDLQPWGSHPLVDPLWSSDRVRVYHDGGHLSRVAKTMQIANEPAVHNHLRVCLSKKTDYNCGECVKCLRTMLGLELAGALQDSTVFPTDLDLQSIRDIQLTTRSQVIFMDELVRYATEYGREDIADALKASINRYRR